MATKRSRASERNIDLNRVFEILRKMREGATMIREDNWIKVGEDDRTNASYLQWLYNRGLVKPVPQALASGTYVISDKGIVYLDIVRSTKIP